MQQRHCFLSNCGTSLLTNGREALERQLVTKHSNARARADLPETDAEMLARIIDDVREQIQSADLPKISRMSAELNTLIRFGSGKPFVPQDAHLLLCTDTWLGEEAARLVETYLQRQGCVQTSVIRQKDLQTASLESFQLALSELVRWLEENLPDYRAKGFRIVFNLTGGFKSVQGFLQSLAPFYADEVVYIFESQSELLRIPRLPVRMIATEVIRDNLNTVRRIALGLQADMPLAVPEMLLLQIGSDIALSPWGELIWQQARRELYAEKLWPSPSPRLVFGPRFADAINKLARERVAILNERIDDLARFIERDDRPNPRRLDFKQLKSNRHLPSTHECDAWSDQDARRLFGHYEGPLFVLDELGKKL